MATNKRQPGFYKAKEIYLLSGLIFCGECGHALQENHRPECKNRPKYVTYRCGNRDRTKQCDNKEIRREYVEMYVLHQLQERLFNDKAIPHLVQMLNQYQLKSNTSMAKEVSEMEVKLKEIIKQIANIITAIENGFFQESFKTRMTDLEKEKQSLEISIQQLSIKNTAVEITEDNLRNMFKMFKQFVTEKNIPECKKFISSYVDKVIVYKDHLEVTFKVAFSFEQKNNIYSFKTSVKMSNLFKTYRKVAGM